MKELFRDLEFKVYTPALEKTITKDGRRLIKGYASTSDLDRQQEIISRPALEGAKNDLLENATVFIEHQHSAMSACGKTIECVLDDKGLLITVELSKAKFVDDIWTLIEEGILNSFSIGGVVLDGHDERDDDGKAYHVIDKICIMEVSIVGLPAQQNAKFSVCKSFHSAIAEQLKLKEGSINMAEQNKQEVVKVEQPKEVDTSEKVSEETKKEEAKEDVVEEKKEVKEVVEEPVKIDVDVSLVDEAEKVEDAVTVESKDVVEKPKEEEAKVEDSEESKEEVAEKPAEEVAEEEVPAEVVKKSEETSPEKEKKEEAKVEKEDTQAEKSTDEKILDRLALIIEKLSALDKKESEEKKKEPEAEKTEDEKARGDGQGQGGQRQGDGGATKCVCPSCGKEFTHEKGVPCNDKKCPDCVVALVGKSEEIKEEKTTETKAVEAIVEKKEEVKTEKKEECLKRKSLAVVVPSPYEEEEEKSKDINKTTDSGWNKLFFGK